MDIAANATYTLNTNYELVTVGNELSALNSNLIKVFTKSYSVTTGATLDSVAKMYLGGKNVSADAPSGTILTVLVTPNYIANGYWNAGGIVCGYLNGSVYVGTMAPSLSPSVKVTWLYQ